MADSSTKFFTNSDQNTLFDKFAGIFDHNTSIAFFDALAGYVRASGYFKVQPLMKRMERVRILVGINTDSLLAEAQAKGLTFFGDQEKTRSQFLEDFKADISSARYDKPTEEGMIAFVEDLVSKRIEVRAHPQKNIHAKIYIFLPNPFNKHTAPGIVITGSSNFTDQGLGTIDAASNYEFNVQLSDFNDVEFARQEFEKLWEESVSILPTELKKAVAETHLGQVITPHQLFIKLLAEFFGKRAEYDPESVGDMPPGYSKLAYQVDAVNEGYEMLQKHNGFMLADVVGLGKTLVATMIAQKFAINNGIKNTNILVVYPPALEQNWKSTFKDFKLLNNTTFITNGSLHRIINGDAGYPPISEYDLVLVDEAHRFRNSKTSAFEQLQLICKSPKKNNGKIEGDQKKVILISATPLNNRPDDILNLVLLFQDGRKSTLPVTNLSAFFKPLIDKYNDLKKADQIDIEALRKLYSSIRKYVVEPITVRRTRRDIENVPAYREDIKAQGIIFPKVQPPVQVEYKLGISTSKLFYSTVFHLIDEDKIGYFRYRAVAFLKDEIPSTGERRDDLYEFAERTAKGLAKIMKTLMVKRVESSFHAFKISLNNLRKATQNMIDMFEKNQVMIAPDLDINKLIEQGLTDEQIVAKMEEKGAANRVFKADDFKPDFLLGLKKDLKAIETLAKAWDKENEDPKLGEFLGLMKTTLLDKKKNPTGKLVVFSESQDTIYYLEKQLHKFGMKDVLAVTGENRSKLFGTIRENFDANFQGEQKNNFNIILATEVLAEGVNLHRANVLVNYDTPWNATKLMQRFGRVNRIGGKSEWIYSYIFYPSAEGDEEIRLNKTALMKIQAFHTAYGEDNQIYSEKEIIDPVKLFKEGVKEDEDERLRFLTILRDFIRDNPEEYKQILKLPLKVRCGRKAPAKDPRKGKSYVFLKTQRKMEFYQVGADAIEEISPVDAMKAFEAQAAEKQTDQLPASHFEHVDKALKSFEVAVAIDAADGQRNTALHPQALRARKFLKEVAKYRPATEAQLQALKTLIEVVEDGNYVGVVPAVVAVDKNKALKPQQLLEEFEKLARQFPKRPVVALAPVVASSAAKPTLILSETFE